MASLPLRFKAGGDGHSHRPTTKVGHKPFKSRKATKGHLRDLAKGRIELSLRKTRQQQVMSKLDRRNQSKQRQRTKHQNHVKETSVFSGRDGAPRNVAVLPLCRDCDSRRAIEALNRSLDIDVAAGDAISVVPIERFKQKLQYIPLERDMTACLDAAQVADFVLVILSATTEVDPLGELILRSITGQGVSSIYTLVQGTEDLMIEKQKQQAIHLLKSYISHFLPGQEKLFNLESRQECCNLMRTICCTTPKGIHWRDSRSWMLVEDVRLVETDKPLTVVTGVIRGNGLKADRLVQLGDVGTFKIGKITAAPLSHKHKNADAMAVNEAELDDSVLETPGEDQDDLTDLAPDEIMVDRPADREPNSAPAKGILLDDHHYLEDDGGGDELSRPIRLPKGTSAYQSAWYLDEDLLSESGSEFDGDVEMRDVAVKAEAPIPADGAEGVGPPEPTEAQVSEYPQSEMAVDQPTEAENERQLAIYRASRHHEVADDKEFPDEIELHPNMLARERLARFRGLKSLRSSPWMPDEDAAYQPADWQRLLQMPDYRRSCLRYTREALVGGVAPGTRVHVYLQGVPADFHQGGTFDARKAPLRLTSLLRHEHKQTVVHHLVSLSSDHPTSVKSKEEMLVQCGPRRFWARPIFSQPGTSANDVHKYCRFLHPGQSAIATFIGPVTWGALPTLVFAPPAPGAPVAVTAPIATGTTLPPSTSRVIVKRAILTGHPYHIHKKVVTVRYMFFHREDVDWFQALPLWTRGGRSGFVKEPVGTHGYFKATFDGRVNPQDAVGVSLYKRMWPRPSTAFHGRVTDSRDKAGDAVVEFVDGGAAA